MVRIWSDSFFKVVVNYTNSTSSLSKAEVSQLFLKKKTRWTWRDVLPVDQPQSSSVRQAFTEGIYGKKVDEIRRYWQNMIFRGRETPPPELASDDEVLSYVLANAGAIGYVSKSARLPEGVKTLKVTG